MISLSERFQALNESRKQINFERTAAPVTVTQTQKVQKKAQKVTKVVQKEFTEKAKVIIAGEHTLPKPSKPKSDQVSNPKNGLTKPKEARDSKTKSKEIQFKPKEARSEPKEPKESHSRRNESLSDRLGKTIHERLGKNLSERLGKIQKGVVVMKSGVILGPKVSKVIVKGAGVSKSRVTGNAKRGFRTSGDVSMK